MSKICKLCGKEFEPKVYNATICYEGHNIPCRICGKLVNIDGHDNRDKQNMYLKKGYVYCSHDCSCAGVGQDKWNKANSKVDMERLKYLRTETATTDTDIARELGTTLDFVISRCERYGWEKPDNLKLEMKQNKNRNISNALTEKYKDEEAKNEMLSKVSKAYKERTGYEHNFKNPDEVKRYIGIKRQKYGDAVNSKKREQTNLNKYGVKSLLEKKEVRQKGIDAIVEKYGYINSTRQHITDDVQKIMDNKSIFIDYISNIPYESRTITIIANKLNLAYTTVEHILNKYECKDLINYATSTFEIEVRNFLNSNNIEFICNARNIISPLELDLYIPEYNVALECNGTYWHSDLDKNYHYNKSKLCEEKGIRLIHIWEHEWNNDRQKLILKNIILNACNKNINRLYARNLNVKVINSNKMKDFFDTNNIQGFRGGKFAICLVDKNTDEIYMSYMMGNAYFGKGKYEWEVIRGATKLGYTVVGGASKIFNYFINEYSPSNCVYYVDYNYFNGNSLKNLPNMEYIKTQISFKNYWVNSGVVKNREPLRHKEIAELYKSGEVRQLWNAGTKVYIWKKESI